MNKYFNILAITVLTAAFTGCKKNTFQAPTSYTMYVVNGGINSKIQTNFTNSPIVIFGTRGVYYAQSGQLVTVADTTALASPFVNSSYPYEKGTYTLFVAGQSPIFETILKEESDLPFIPGDKIYTTADSVVNVRYINLSPNSIPLKIKLSSTTTNEVDALAYKDISTWRSFKAVAVTTTYTLQIKNASTDALITTYSFVANATNRFKNVTLVVKGLQGTTTGVNAFGITPINYF